MNAPSAECTVTCKETLLLAGRLVDSTPSEATRWTRICGGTRAQPGAAAYTAPRSPICYMGLRQNEGLSYPMALRFLLLGCQPPTFSCCGLSLLPEVTGTAMDRCQDLLVGIPGGSLPGSCGPPFTPPWPAQPHQPQRCYICIK